MHTHHIQTPRTARFHTLGDPDAREVWILLHGYGQRAQDFLSSCDSIASPSRLLVAPEGLSRFYLRRGQGPVGASWMTREDRAHEIDDTLRYLDGLLQQISVAQRKLRPTLLGFSQGAAAAWRWVSLGKVSCERLISWGTGVPPDVDLQAASNRLRGTRIEFVRGDDDEWLGEEAARQTVERLEQLGLDAGRRSFRGGHRMDAETLKSLARA